MLIFSQSKSGLPTAKYNNTLLHSAYNPLIEAEKYLNSVFENITATPGVIIILGPALNYLLKIIHERFSETKIIVIHFNTDLFSNSFKIHNNLISYWHPESDIKLKTFLYKNLDEDNIFNKKIIKWEPAFNAFPPEAKDVLNILNQVLNEYSYNISTAGYFGKRCLKNIFKNILDIEKITLPFRIQKPVIITASGESLSKSINTISRLREKLFILSLSSSCSFLSEYKIIPDMIITTDPGYYSLHHLNYSVNEESIIAAPLTSYVGTFKNKNILLLNQGTFLENFCIHRLLIPSVNIKTNGTVAGSAYYLSNILTENPVVYSGLDLCTSDILAHSIPNSLDYITKKHSNRFNPLYSMFFKQAADNYPVIFSHKNRASSQLSAYTSWFNSTHFENNYFRLNKSVVDLIPLKNIDNNYLENIIHCNVNAFSDNQKYESITIDKTFLYENLNNIINHILEICLLSRKNYTITAEIKELFYYFDTKQYFDLMNSFYNKDFNTFKKNYLYLLDRCISFFSSIKKQAGYE